MPKNKNHLTELVTVNLEKGEILRLIHETLKRSGLTENQIDLYQRVFNSFVLYDILVERFPIKNFPSYVDTLIRGSFLIERKEDEEAYYHINDNYKLGDHVDFKGYKGVLAGISEDEILMVRKK